MPTKIIQFSNFFHFFPCFFFLFSSKLSWFTSSVLKKNSKNKKKKFLFFFSVSLGGLHEIGFFSISIPFSKWRLFPKNGTKKKTKVSRHCIPTGNSSMQKKGANDTQIVHFLVQLWPKSQVHLAFSELL